MAFGMIILFGVRNKINPNGIVVKGTVAKSYEDDSHFITIWLAINLDEQKLKLHEILSAVVAPVDFC